MRTTLTVVAKDKANAVVEAALQIEDRRKGGDYQRVTGDPVRVKSSTWGGIKGLSLWRVPVEDEPMTDDLDLMGLTEQQQAVASDVLAYVRQRLTRLEVTSDPLDDGDWQTQINKTLDDIESEVYGR